MASSSPGRGRTAARPRKRGGGLGPILPVRLGQRGRDSPAGYDGSVLLFRLGNPIVRQVRRRRMPLGEAAALVDNPLSSRFRPPN